MKPLTHRPKSMNFSIETSTKTKGAYLENPFYKSGHMSLDSPVGSISRERTPPFSSTSSITSVGALPTYKPPPKVRNLY